MQKNKFLPSTSILITYLNIHGTNNMKILKTKELTEQYRSKCLKINIYYHLQSDVYKSISYRTSISIFLFHFRFTCKYVYLLLCTDIWIYVCTYINPLHVTYTFVHNVYTTQFCLDCCDDTSNIMLTISSK